MKKTRVLPVSALQPEPDRIQIASDILRAGGLVAFPTETVYGLGANALSESAVEGIFTAKGRPSTDPLIVHLPDVAELERVAIVNDPRIYALAERFWPGALTLILPKQPIVPAIVTANQPTVAVRVPSHPIALALLRHSGVPISAPSANRFSRPSPTSALHVLNDLDGRIECVLDGGSTPIGVESTILDLTRPQPTVLRAGGVPMESLRDLLPEVTFQHLRLKEGEIAPASGTLLKHYSPRVPVWLLEGSNSVQKLCELAQAHHQDGVRVGILADDATLELLADVPSVRVSLGQTDQHMAHRLFEGLRHLETVSDIIFVPPFSKEGLGLAVWDRLFRASEGRVIQTEN